MYGSLTTRVMSLGVTLDRGTYARQIPIHRALFFSTEIVGVSVEN